MIRKIISVFILLTCYLNYTAQDSISKVKLSPYYDSWGEHLEYSYCQSNSVGVGINYMIEPLHKWILHRQIAYTFDLSIPFIFYKNVLIMGQRIDVGMNCEGLSPDIHIFIEHNDKNDLRIGGKIGVSIADFMYLHYRYALPLGNYENCYVSRHGLTLTFKYNFVAISHLYGP